MRIKLIEPKFRGEWGEHDEKVVNKFWFARLTMPTIAALTPSDVEVSITDENIEEIDYDEPVDLVGLTAMTMHAPAAYAIAAKFRKRGIPVVMGGIHASLRPEEAKEHVDSVVVGEAEGLWPQVVEDARAGRLAPIYRSQGHPRMDLLRAGAYDQLACVQTTRGCPFACDYCTVSRFFGRTYRTRPVDEVIQEVQSLDARNIAFVDDNIIGNPKYAKELFRQLIPLNIKWGSQASISIANDRELLSLAAESGCYSLFIGIESLDQDNLRDVHKKVNRVEEYEEALKVLHDHGMTVIGSFILGLDHDDEFSFERILRFCERNKIELPVFFILTPIPGTPTYQHLEAEGRILDRNWEHYDGMHVVFRPRLMSPETLQQGFQWLCQEAYSWRSIARRVLMPPGKRSVRHCGLNVVFRRIAQRVPRGQFSPLSRSLPSLNDAVPIRDVSNLLPTLPEDVLHKGRAWVRDTYSVLRIRATYHEPIKTIFVHLEGAMDLASAKTLISKVGKALQTGHRIVIDFEQVHHLSPTAANLLLRENLERLRAWRDRIQLVHLADRIQCLLGNVGSLLEGTPRPDADSVVSKKS
jgi:radical SAM superfamily enzyme YgiQ (UPF0313 family)/anti-anti-sigma regulatory factor